MTEFELLAIPISLVLGLGITKMLSGAVLVDGLAFVYSRPGVPPWGQL